MAGTIRNGYSTGKILSILPYRGVVVINEKLFRSPPFLDRLREGDASAIEQLVRAYTRPLHNTLLGMGLEGDDAQELVQQVWIAFFEKSAQFEGRSHIKTYLYGILYNKCRQWRRGRKEDSLDEMVERQVDSRFDGKGRWHAPPMEPERFALLAERMELLDVCLEDLPDAQRMAFVLKEGDGIDAKEICNVLDVTVTNLRVLLFRARNRLRECIESKDKERE